MQPQMGQTIFRTLKFQTTVMEVAAALTAWSHVSFHFNKYANVKKDTETGHCAQIPALAHQQQSHMYARILTLALNMKTGQLNNRLLTLGHSKISSLGCKTDFYVSKYQSRLEITVMRRATICQDSV